MLLFGCGLIPNKLDNCLSAVKSYSSYYLTASSVTLEQIKPLQMLLQSFFTLLLFTYECLGQGICALPFSDKRSDGQSLVLYLIFSPKYRNVKAMWASVTKKLKLKASLLVSIAAELTLKACFSSKAASWRKMCSLPSLSKHLLFH